MKEHSAVQLHLFCIFNGSEIIKEDNKFWSERLKREYNIREKQKGTPYTKWLRYLKEKHLYCEYVKDIKTLMLNCGKNGHFDQFITQVVFTPCTINQVKEVVTHLDNHIPYKHLNGGYWQTRFTEFESEDNLEIRKKLLANRLYHMNIPKTTHHTYLGSTKPSPHFLDDLIDKIFFIKRK